MKSLKALGYDVSPRPNISKQGLRGRKHSMTVAIVVRQQNTDEERRCDVAIQSLLTELVRQQRDTGSPR